MSLVIPAPEAPILPVSGQEAGFPVRRVFCIGRNYADHAKEMGAPAEAIFFMKPADSVITAQDVPYPAETVDLHHEVEMVLALGEGGSVWGAGVGIDLTRRDLQKAMKEKRAPWEIGKAFEASAPVGPIRQGPPPTRGAIRLAVNGETRQEADLADLILPPDALLAELGRYFTLKPGDLVFTGTPAGVAATVKGDRLSARIEGLPDLDIRLS